MSAERGIGTGRKKATEQEVKGTEGTLGGLFSFAQGWLCHSPKRTPSCAYRCTDGNSCYTTETLGPSVLTVQIANLLLSTLRRV